MQLTPTLPLTLTLTPTPNQRPGLPGALDKYKQCAVPTAPYENVELPPNPTAGGFRHGAADMLAVAVPATIAVHTTGHNLEKLSALWEYIGARIALLMPSAVALAGCPPLPCSARTGGGRPIPSCSPSFTWAWARSFSSS